MEGHTGRIADLISRLDGLREPTLTRLADAIKQAKLTVADVADHVQESSPGYHRSLVVRRDGYELLVLTWRPGQGSVPHDHAGSISAMQVLQGEAIEGSWRIAADGYVDREFENPVPRGEMTAWQDAGVHTVRNPDDAQQPLITVHVYAPPLKDFRRFVARPESSVERPKPSCDVPVIVVVGGGFSGSMAAAQILRRAAARSSPVRVVLIERQGAVGEGLAYATRDQAHLLNVPAGKMSAWPDRPDDFVRWAARSHRTVAPGEFLPRAWYGEYVREALTAAAHEAAPSATLNVVFDEVRRLVRRPAGGWMVSLARGASISCAAVVLAIGHRPPSDPIGRLWSGPRARFIGDPWRAFATGPIQNAEPVVVLGSGLTAVDAVLTLGQSGRTAPITLVSRHGLAPQAHAAAPAAPAVLTNLVEQWTAAPDALRVTDICRQLRTEIRARTESGGDWRSVIDGLRPHTAALWRALPVAEKRRFLAHLRPYWEIHRHRMALDVAKRFAELAERRLVRLVAGSVAAVQAEDGGVRLYVRQRGDERLIELRTGWVINCTGPAASNSAESNPVIGSLLVHGWVRADELSLGLDTTPAGNAIDAAGRAADDLFVVGTLRKPHLWESTAVPELREQAAAVAERLLDQLGLTRAQAA